jgi:hypothetical protein
MLIGKRSSTKIVSPSIQNANNFRHVAQSGRTAPEALATEIQHHQLAAATPPSYAVAQA